MKEDLKGFLWELVDTLREKCSFEEQEVFVDTLVAELIVQAKADVVIAEEQKTELTESYEEAIEEIEGFIGAAEYFIENVEEIHAVDEDLVEDAEEEVVEEELEQEIEEEFEEPLEEPFDEPTGFLSRFRI